MKTVGQFLHSARIQKDLSVDELSKLTKVDVKYILALEADKYEQLPSETFAKGFIRILSRHLGSNPDELIAIFRRDYRHPNPKAPTSTFHKSSSIHLSRLSSRLISTILGVTVFLIYLAFQFRVILTPPQLTISQPVDNLVSSSPVEIKGVTSVDSLVTINNDNTVKPDQDGLFQIYLNLPVGETVINIKSTNRFSRSTEKNISLTIISK